jgi:hypothetical protein
VVRRRARANGLSDFRPDALYAATWCPLIASDPHFLKPNQTPLP